MPVLGSKSKGIRPANTITPEKRRQAATLVRTGESVSLSHDLITGGGVASEFSVPFVLQMKVFPERQVARDRIDIDPHGGAFTHLDALCHMAYKGRFYNNVPYETATAAGCKLGGSESGTRRCAPELFEPFHRYQGEIRLRRHCATI